jgi:hypothetical protein
MNRAIHRFQQQVSRNRLLQLLKCGKKTLQNVEDMAVELVPDFREGLDWNRVVGVLGPEGSIEVKRERRGALDPYQVWVLKQLVALCRKYKGDPETAYDRAFKLAKKLSRDKFND